MARSLGRYQLHHRLGRGGQGEVWAATLHGPAGFRKEVALKVLHGSGEGLLREARLGGLLRHVNLVDVYEVGEVGGTWFCAMELCEGGTLETAGPLPPRALVEAGLQVCEALQYAHEELGLVHLDLKPANLLLQGATVKVADLGIARAEGFDQERVAGTPGYIAPEVLRGAPVDARADVYALGKVLRELAEAPAGEERAAGGSDTFSLEDLGPEDGWALDEREVAGWLDPVISRCLDPDPRGRFQSMAEVAEALRALPVHGPGLGAFLEVAEAAPLASGEGIAAATDGFVGRGRAQAELRDLLAHPALVTIKGTGGMGKTRLARRVARGLAEERGWPTWFCDLSDASSLSSLLHVVAGALAVPLGRGDLDAHTWRIGHALGSRGPCILVLDNVEHLVEEAAVVTVWRQLAPEARLVVTSRRNLGVDQERVFELGPLLDDEAVELLRIRALDRGRDVGGDPALRELARRLDGLPLALELAAGRIGVLSPSEVLERMGPSMLRSGDARPDRQATLRGALDWSWGLLDDEGRSVLAQLSVFRGGFTAEAAEAVVATGRWILDALDGLMEASLVSVRSGRFLLLEPVREYASEKLEHPSETLVRHGRYFASLLETGPSLYAELENLTHACHEAVGRGDADIAARAAVKCWEVYKRRGPFQEGAALLEAAMEVPGAASWLRLPVHVAETRRMLTQPIAAEAMLLDVLDRARAEGDRAIEGLALQALGSVYVALSRWEDVERCHGEALELFRVQGDLRRQIVSLIDLAVGQVNRRDTAAAARNYRRARRVIARSGETRNLHDVLLGLALTDCPPGSSEARARLQEALAAAERHGDRRGEAYIHSHLALWYAEAHRNAEAIDAYERALVLLRRVGERGMEASVTGNLGNALRKLGRNDEALGCYERALALHREQSNRRSEGVVLLNRGILLQRQGRAEAARASLTEALGAFRDAEIPFWVAAAEGCLGEVLAESGRWEEAAALLGSMDDSVLDDDLTARFRVIRGEAWCRTGDEAAGVREREEGFRVLRQHGVELLGLLGSLVRGARRRGERDVVEALIEEARVVAESLPVERRDEVGVLLGELTAS